MRLRWPVWGGRTSHRSRPRVAQAVRAARAAQATSGAEARAPWGAMSLAVSVAGGMAGTAGQTHATAGLSPSLLWATARAARATGRQPADVWAEALQRWLAERESTDDESDGRAVRVALDARRALAWRAIDATLGELRAG
jgi:hypothetical protein